MHSERLNREWTYLVESTRERRDACSWAANEPALARCATLDELLGAVSDDPDAVLLALVRQCQQGHGLAGRVVVQALLGALVARASRDVDASLDDYVSHCWLTIATYPLHRTRAVAANIVLDTLKGVRSERWRCVPVEEPDLLLGPSNREDERVDVRALLRVACALGFVTAETSRVLHSVYADGLSGKAAAQRHGSTPMAVRKRCSDAVRRLSLHRDELLAAT